MPAIRLPQEGLLAISWRDKLRVSDTDRHDDEGLAGLFTEAERKAYEDARTYKAMKNRISLDSPELQAPVHALQGSFDDMDRWERMADQKGRGNHADIDALFARRVSWSRKASLGFMQNRRFSTIKGGLYEIRQ